MDHGEGGEKFDSRPVRARSSKGLFEETAICAQASGVPLRGTSYYRALLFIPVPLSFLSFLFSSLFFSRDSLPRLSGLSEISV